MITSAPGGVWPPMLTPYLADGTIDWESVDRLTDWYLAAGVAGLFAVAQSSEMFHLDDDERLALARRVVSRVADRVPVVASGTFVRSVEAQAEFIHRLANTGVAAVTVLVSMLAEPDEDDRLWRQRAEQLLRLTAPLPLALYECPAPYHRLLSPALVGWAAQSGRFILLKETSRSLAAVKAKIAATQGTSLGLFNADTTGLLPALRAGGAGYCGIAANFFPDLLAWLCANHTGQPAAAEALQSLFDLADPLVHSRYPVSAKRVGQLAGLIQATGSRSSTAALTDYDERVLSGLLAQLQRQRATLPTPHRPGPTRPGPTRP